MNTIKYKGLHLISEAVYKYLNVINYALKLSKLKFYNIIMSQDIIHVFKIHNP